MTEITKEPEISDAMLDELLKDYENPEDLLGPDGIFRTLKKTHDRESAGRCAPSTILTVSDKQVVRSYSVAMDN